MAPRSSGKLAHCASNHCANMPASSGDSEACIRLRGFPGERPRPSVVRATAPRSACTGSLDSPRMTSAPCGTPLTARRTAARLLSHACRRPASQRDCKLLRAARSPFEPSKMWPVRSPGSTNRHASAQLSPISPQAKIDNAGVTVSMERPSLRCGRTMSATRSLPVLRTSLNVLGSLAADSSP